MVASTIFKTAAQIAARMAGKSSVGKSPAGLRSLLKTSEDIPVSVLEHPMSMEIIQHPALVKSYDRWLKMKGRPKEYGEEELRLINEEELRLDDLESPFSPVGLTREERGYFTNLPRSGSGISEKKLSPTEVEFFEDMIREGDPYDFMRDVPSAKIRTDKKGNKYLRVQGEMEDLFRFIEDTNWDTGDLPSTMRRGDWYNKFKEISEFKHGGGLSGIGEKIIYRDKGGSLSNLNKSININGQPHSLAWIRPDEASALKAMGGSGKKVEGIPAYFYADQGSYDSGMVGDPAISDAGEYGWASDTYDAPATYGGTLTADNWVTDDQGYPTEPVYGIPFSDPRAQTELAASSGEKEGEVDDFENLNTIYDFGDYRGNVFMDDLRRRAIDEQLSKYPDQRDTKDVPYSWPDTVIAQQGIIPSGGVFTPSGHSQQKWDAGHLKYSYGNGEIEGWGTKDIYGLDIENLPPDMEVAEGVTIDDLFGWFVDDYNITHPGDHDKMKDAFNAFLTTPGGLEALYDGYDRRLFHGGRGGVYNAAIKHQQGITQMLSDEGQKNYMTNKDAGEYDKDKYKDLDSSQLKLLELGQVLEGTDYSMEGISKGLFANIMSGEGPSFEDIVRLIPSLTTITSIGSMLAKVGLAMSGGQIIATLSSDRTGEKFLMQEDGTLQSHDLMIGEHNWDPSVFRGPNILDTTSERAVRPSGTPAPISKEKLGPMKKYWERLKKYIKTHPHGIDTGNKSHTGILMDIYGITEDVARQWLGLGGGSGNGGLTNINIS